MQTVSPEDTGCAAGSLTRAIWTVGALLKWVIPSSSINCHMWAGSTRRRQTIVAPTATAPHAKHQPLQWKRGATSSSRDLGVRPASITLASAFR